MANSTGNTLFSCLLAAFSCISFAKATSAQSTATAEPPAAEQKLEATEVETKTAAKSEAASEPEKATTDKPSKPKLPEFMRVAEKDGKPQALQTAVAKYHLADSDSAEPIEVTLIGAVHIGEATYYSRLNQLFRQYDSLLFEMVMDPEMGMPDPNEESRGLSPVSTIQVGMKTALNLAFQLDEINYKAKNFVHADMTPQEFFDCMEKRKEGVMSMFFRSLGASLAQQSSGQANDIEVLSAMVSGNPIALRRSFAQQMEMADGQMAALTGKDGKSVLITERNAAAFEVLRSELDDGKKKIGVFYGAGHLKDMHERLLKDFDMELVEIDWLDAWNLQ
ncbi:MAG TPA: hypothetical protein DDW52_19370 [Planctomycetaceae bacterium]|nr:hypothetical protein [Planctomycetaceae bacterium]